MSKTKRWTIAEVRAANGKAGGHFFDRETMRFFDQRVRDFRVRNVDTPNGVRVFLWAVRGKNGTAYNVHEFTPATGDIAPVQATCYDFRKPTERKRFFRAERS